LKPLSRASASSAQDLSEALRPLQVLIRRLSTGDDS
jgi:hypothetical protein